MTIVLVGGSGLGPWAWQRVTPILNARGLRTRTPRLRATAGFSSISSPVVWTAIARDGAVPWFTRSELDQLYPGHGLSDEDFAWMQPKLTPQPMATYAQPAIAEPLDPTRARLVYVRCLRTTPPAPDLEQTSPGWTIRTLDAGHWPMITRPEATARIIEEFSGSTAPGTVSS